MKSFLNKIFLVGLIIMFAFNLNAQHWNRYKYEFGYGVGSSNFMGDVSAPKNTNALVWVKFINTVGPVANVSLKYNLQERQYLQGGVVVGQMYAEDPIGDDKYHEAGRRSNSIFTEISARYEYMIFKEKSRRTVYRVLGESSIKNLSLPTYLFAGLGGYLSYGSFSQISQKTVLSNNYFVAAPVVPVGIGVKLRINKLNYFSVEAGARFVVSDKLDNVINGWFDQYQFITFNYSYKIRANQRGLPRFGK